MRPRHGFTVLELLVALTLTAVALTLTGTALSAARSTEAAIDRSRAVALPTAQARVLLTDLLRHLPSPEEVDGPLLTLTSEGRAPTLSFLSRGLDVPFGTGPIWSVRLAQQGDTLVIDASPLRAEPGLVARRILVSGTAPLEITALGSSPTGMIERRTAWASGVQLPAALALRWGRDRDGGAGTELIVALDPLGRSR